MLLPKPFSSVISFLRMQSSIHRQIFRVLSRFAGNKTDIFTKHNHGISRLSSCTSSCVKMYASNKSPEDLQTFHRQADETLEQVTEALENYVDEHEVEGSDIEHTQGVLTIKLGTLGSYVINKQTPNKQIWLSSPVSGPFRYDLKEGAWIYERAGEARRELISQLETEISDLVGVELKINN